MMPPDPLTEDQKVRRIASEGNTPDLLICCLESEI
jgi:hypothetical protein